MVIKFNVDGLEELQEDLNDLSKRVENLGGEVSFDIMFNKKFMRLHSKFSTFDELLDNSKFEVTSNEDFENIPDNEFDEYIAQVTDFPSWEDMLQCATNEYLQNQLSL